jgi:hypothetical protein
MHAVYLAFPGFADDAACTLIRDSFQARRGPGVFFAQEEPRHNTAGTARFLSLPEVFLRSITIATLPGAKT